MGWNKLSEYTRGRDDGLALAWKIIQESGVEGFRNEMKFRNKTGIHTNLMLREVEQFTEPFKKVMLETMQVGMVAALHDEFGFGQQRCQRAVDAIEKVMVYRNHGWLYWIDVMGDIKKRLNLDLEDTELKKNDSFGKYYHPEPEDLYDERDLVDEAQWRQLLRDLDFREPEKGVILDENRQVLFRYKNPYDKIALSDFLCGMLFEKNGRRYDENDKSA